METNKEVVSIENSEPRTIGEIFGAWSEIFKMTERFFAAELPRSSNKATHRALLIYTLLIALLQAIAEAIHAASQPTAAFGIFAQNNFPLISFFITFLYAIVLFPIGFYVINGIFYASAKLFGGKGKFSDQAYLTSLFLLPLSFIIAVITAIPFKPFVGLINLGLVIYQIILQIRAFIVVHKITYVKASEAVVIPYFLILVVSIPLIIALMRTSSLF